MKWHWRYLAIFLFLWFCYAQGMRLSSSFISLLSVPIAMAALWFGLGWLKKVLMRFIEEVEEQRNDPKVTRGVGLGTSIHLRRVIELNAKGIRRTDENGRETEKWKAAERTLRNDPSGPDSSIFERWIRLAQIPIPPTNETLHFAITASTGAGKSVALRGMLADIRARGDRAIVIDNGGEFGRDFGAPEDLVLSPFDSRSLGWNLINEVKEPYDWPRLARSIVPDGHGNEKSWHEMAQKLLANLGSATHADNAGLLAIATGFNGKALQPLLAGTSSSVLTQDGGERLLTNIRSVFGTTLQCWQYMKSGGFSLRDYMQGTDPRWLWIPFQESQLGVARDLIASWMDILVSAGLERIEGSQKTWIIIDELDTLGELSSLIAATTKLRKRNVCVVVAFQSYSQVVDTYGKDRASTLLNCFSNKLVLRSVDGETAEKLSLELGERDRWKDTSDAGQGRHRVVTNTLQKERAVLPSQIQNLPDLEGFIKLAGDYPIALCRVSLDNAKPRHGLITYAVDLPVYDHGEATV